MTRARPQVRPGRLARTVAIGIAVVAAALTAPGAAGTAFARNLALLIGVAAYDDPAIRPLQGPRNDVILRFGRSLGSGGWRFCNRAAS